MAIFLFQDGGRPPSWILIQVKNGVTARCRLPMSTTTPNLVTIAQMAAELLRFVENLYLATLDHTRRLLVDLKRHRKFGVDRPSSFQDIGILKF